MYDPIQGRWLSPDPLGFDDVDEDVGIDSEQKPFTLPLPILPSADSLELLAPTPGRGGVRVSSRGFVVFANEINGHPDPANPYRFVGNDPLNRRDPTGLFEMPVTYPFVREGGKEADLKNNTFKVGDGTGTVRVYTDATTKYLFSPVISTGGIGLGSALNPLTIASTLPHLQMARDFTSKPDKIVIEFKTEGTPCPPKAYWIQFAAREVLDNMNNQVDYKFASTKAPGQSLKVLYHRTGQTHLDAYRLDTPVYAGATRRTENELSIADSPTPVEKPGFSKTIFGGESFLVVDGKVVYQVTWFRVTAQVQDGVYRSSYFVTGDQPKTLPAYLKNDKLFAGYEDVEMTKAHYIDNPIPKEARQ